jgi:hypothetical protein
MTGRRSPGVSPLRGGSFARVLSDESPADAAAAGPCCNVPMPRGASWSPAVSNTPGRRSSTTSDYIGTEHILLALLDEGDGVAAQVLAKLGADLNQVRQQVIQLLQRPPASGSGQSFHP